VLTEETMGWVLSCEIINGIKVLMFLSDAEDNRVDGAIGKPSIHLAQSETPCTWRSSLYGTWEVSLLPFEEKGRSYKAKATGAT